EDIDASKYVRGRRYLILCLLECLNYFRVVGGILLSRSIDDGLICYCRRYDGGHSATQWSNVTFPIRMHPVTKKDQKHVTRGINPDRGSRKTCVTEGAERKHIASIA